MSFVKSFKALVITFSISLFSFNSFAANLDYTSFTEVDVPNKIGVTSDCISFSSIETRKTTSYVTKSQNTSGDFTYDFDTMLTSSDTFSGETAIWGISNTANDTYDDWADGVIVGWAGIGGTPKLEIQRYPLASANSQGLNYNQRYYVTIERIASTLKMHIYSDSGRTSLIQTVSRSFNSNSYNQLYAFSLDNRNLSNKLASGDVCHLSDGSSGGTDTEAPTVPTNLSGSAITETSFNLNWLASTDNVGVTTYKLDIATDDQFNTIVASYNNKDLGNVLSTSVINLIAETEYYVRLRAEDAAGNISSNSGSILISTTDIQAPTSPGNLSGSNITENSFNLSWSASTDDVGVTKYKLDIATDDQFVSILSSYNNKDLGDVLSTVVTNLTPETGYFVRLRAEDAAGNVSSNTSTVIVSTTQSGGGGDTQAPTMPGNVSGSSITGNSFNLSWLASTDNVGVTTYKLDIATDDQFNTIVASYNNKDLGNVLSTAVINLILETEYYVRLRSEDAAGNISSNSSSILISTTDIQAPTAPGNPTFLNPTTNSLNLTWSASTDNFGVTDYRLDVATDSSFNNILGNYNNKSLGVVTATVVSGLNTNTTYFARLRAGDAGGNTSVDSSTAQGTTSTSGGGGSTTFEVRVSESRDDAEETSGGNMMRISPDLEMGEKKVGVRFQNVTIPQGAQITNAFIQFKAEASDSAVSNLVIQAENTANAPQFLLSSQDISNRSLTNASVAWAPSAWTIGNLGADQKTPDISSVISEVINRADWQTGNSLIVIVTGSGEREAESYNGEAGAAPLLHIEYSTGAPSNDPVLNPIGNQSVDLGNSLTLNLTATDPNSDPLTFSASPLPLPNNATLNASTGEFNLTPDATQVGSFSLTFIVSDGLLTDSETVIFTVNGSQPGANTSLSGRILDTNDYVQGFDTPIVGATVSIIDSGISAVSDSTGNFTLSNIPSGSQVFDINSTTANVAPDGSGYAGFREEINIIDAVNNNVSRPFFIPRIDASSLTTVDPNVTTIVDNLNLGVSFEVAPQTAKNEDGSLFTGDLSISIVPDGLAPAAMPDEFDPAMLITIQPVGVSFTTPAPIIFPNSDNLPAGTILNIWSLDPEIGEFVVVGMAKVSSDGLRVETISGGIRRADWHFVIFASSIFSNTSINNFDHISQQKCEKACTGSQTAITTGNLVVNHDLASYQSLNQERGLQLKYNSLYAYPQPVLNVDNNIFGSVAPLKASVSLKAAGIDVGSEVFVDTSGIVALNEIVRQSVLFDASNLTTGRYPYEVTAKSYFTDSALSNTRKDEVTVINLKDSSFGAGWSLTGLQQLHEQDAGDVLLVDGEGTSLHYRKTSDIVLMNEIQISDLMREIEITDFNEDGKKDLLVANESLDSEIEIYFGNGDGTFFSTVLSIDLPARPLSVVINDLNNDGYKDIVVTFSGVQEGASVYLGDGAGGFANPINVLGMQRNILTVGDYNNDGNLDIASGVFPSGFHSDLLIHLGDGTGHFSNPIINLASIEGSPVLAESVDFNRDGILDLVVVEMRDSCCTLQLSSGVSFWEGDGLGNFVESNTFVGPFFPREQLESLVIKDMDKDGNEDIVVSGNKARIYYGDGQGLFPFVTIEPNIRFDMVVRDFNNDGMYDLLGETHSNDFSFSVSLNVGERSFSSYILYDLSDDFFAIDILSVDLNQDGLLDVVASNSSDDKISIFSQNVLNSFQSPKGDFSELRPNVDNSYTRRLKDGVELNFNANGLQTSVVDRNGNTVFYTYDAQNRLSMITDPSNLTTTINYTGAYVSNIVDPFGRTTLLEHDIEGNLEKIIDPDNTFRQFSYDGLHHMVSQTSKRDFTTTYDYNFAGRNIQANRPDGSVRQVQPVEMATIIDVTTGLGTESNPAPIVLPDVVQGSFTDSNNNSAQIKTNNFGASISSTDALANKTTIERDENSNPTIIKKPDNTEVELTYDEKGNLTVLVEVGPRFTNFDYEGVFNQITNLRDHDGHETSFEYDTNGNLTKQINTLNKEKIFTYNINGQVLTETDENLHTTIFTYDSNGNLATKTDADGSVTTFVYDSTGNILSLTEAFGTADARTTLFTYDALNRVLTSTDAENATTQFRYDNEGNLLETELPTGEITVRTYDEMNRLKTINDPISGLTQLTYDLNGNLISSINSLNHITTFEYDVLNRLVKSIDPLTGEQFFTYDEVGNLTSIKDAKGQTTTFEYDGLNRQTQITNPLNEFATFTYDKRDNLITHVDPKGQLTTNTYDDLSRLIQSVTPDNTIINTYDDVGNVLTTVDNDSSLSFAYNNVNNPLTVSTINVGVQPASTLTNTFNLLGNRTQLLDSAGGATQFDYDNVNRLTQLITPTNNTINLSYDLTGRLTQIAHPNNTFVNYQYDVQGRLNNLNHKLGAATLANLDYVYNALGNITSVTEQSQTKNYGYDALQRLLSGGTAATPETYTYDPVGNRIASHLSNAHTVDAANKLLDDDNFTYTYDANGNLATKTAKVGGAVTTYHYDAQNQLIQIDHPNATTSTYKYDGLGRRIEKNVNGTITRYIYDGEDILLEYDGTNTLQARYSHGDQTDQPLSQDRGGQSYFYHADHQGSIRMITNASGAIVNSYDYDSYGKINSITESSSNPYLYTAREYDAESGLFYYRARYYDPETGRFISEDPIGFNAGDVNFYRYVFNNPSNLTDPSGEVVPILVAAGIGAITGFVTDALIETSFQLLDNGGKFECLNGGQIFSAGLRGAVFGVVSGGITKGIFSTSRKIINNTKKIKKVRNVGVGNSFNPRGPRIQTGVNPKTLKPRKDLSSLDKGRLKRVEEFGRDQAIDVERSGVVRQGHHRIRNAIDRGRSIDVNVID